MDHSPTMPGTRVLGTTAATPIELDAVLRRGLPTTALQALAAHLSLSVRSTLPLARLSASRFYALHRAGQPLSARTGRALYDLARMIEIVEATAPDPAVARRWLCTPHPALGGRVPLSLAALLDAAAWAQQQLAAEDARPGDASDPASTP